MRLIRRKVLFTMVALVCCICVSTIASAGVKDAERYVKTHILKKMNKPTKDAHGVIYEVIDVQRVPASEHSQSVLNSGCNCVCKFHPTLIIGSFVKAFEAENYLNKSGTSVDIDEYVWTVDASGLKVTKTKRIHLTKTPYCVRFWRHLHPDRFGT